MMKLLSTTLFVILASFTAAAAAETAPSWHFAAAGMGQYEGGVTLEDGSAGITYSCSGLGAHLTFWAKGMHIAPGKTQITVDGKEIALARPQAGYLSLNDQTTQSLDVAADYGKQMKGEINAVISALAKGKEAVWTTPNGDSFTFPLAGSSNITHCKM